MGVALQLPAKSYDRTAMYWRVNCMSRRPANACTSVSTPAHYKLRERYTMRVTRKNSMKSRTTVRPPKEAMRTLVEWTFQFDLGHSHFVRPVMIENIRLGRHEGKQWPAERRFAA